MMAEGTKRRRGKLEIAEAKRAEAARKEEVDRKMAAFDKMQAEIAQLKRQTADMQKAENAINGLHEVGLIRRDADGSFSAVESYDEHRRILQMRIDEQNMVNQAAMEQEMQFNVENDPGRMAAGNQLEPIENQEQAMEDVEVSDAASVIEKRKPGRPRKNH